MISASLVQNIAREIADETFLVHYKFYIIIIAISFLGAVAGSYLRGFSLKKGEFAAINADSKKILEQLRLTTATAKEIEISLSHGDWRKREENILMRAKLEQLIVAALSLATWAKTNATACFSGSEATTHPPIDEFEMLHNLYFSDLDLACDAVHLKYLAAQLTFSTIRQECSRISSEFEMASQTHDVQRTAQLVAERKSYYQNNNSKSINAAKEVMVAVNNLGKESKKLMRNLVSNS